MTSVLEQRWSSDNSYNSEDTIVSRFERQVRAVPDKLALVTDETSLTYQALDLKASRIAAALATFPSQRDRPIMLFVADEVAHIAAMIGALKANRIFIPLARDSPANWITQVIEDSGTAHIIVDNFTNSIAAAAAIGRVTILEFDDLASASGAFEVDGTASADDMAYIVYTSGSTGRPKGVAITHSSSLHRHDQIAVHRVGRTDRFARLSSIGLSAAINHTLLPILSGGTLYPFNVGRNGLDGFALWVNAKKISQFRISGSLLRTWLTYLRDDFQLPTLRFVGVWGERLHAEDIVRISRHLGGDCLLGYNYSSTECGTIAAQVFTRSRLPEAGIVPVGRPVDGVELSIEDETCATVPAGEVGEVVVRSRYLAKGYWNNPELTAKVFQTDPLNSAFRIYHTGDLGRWRSDGTLEIVGRKGRTIRLRGFNIEPFQVECELLCQPDVTDAVVLLHEGAAGQEPCLVAYVVAPPDASPSAIRKGLAERLPSYMVPSHIVVLESFPIARSGKIDLKALPPPQLESSREGEFRPPSTDGERELCAIWQDVLKVPKIGIDDDFFELGGTSLQALLMFARIEAKLGCSLSPTVLVQAPTVARLAELTEPAEASPASQSSALVPLRASGAGQPLFLVSGRTWVAMFYRHLVGDLKSDRPVYGLQPPPLDGKHRIARTVEAMAGEYIADIKRVQPQGPYFLAGHSFGGWVSFEIAQQLMAAGEQVGFLGLIDTMPRNVPVASSPLMSEAVHLGRRVRHVSDFQDLLFQGQRYVRNAVLDLWFRQGHSIPHKYRPEYFAWVCTRVSRNYSPKPYAGHVTMFGSAGSTKWRRDYWTPLACGGLTILEVPAGHVDMVLPPHSKLLAEHFDNCLDTNPAHSRSSPAASVH
jgi:amino acid adenylation domain-containing protein